MPHISRAFKFRVSLTHPALVLASATSAFPVMRTPASLSRKALTLLKMFFSARLELGSNYVDEFFFEHDICARGDM